MHSVRRAGCRQPFVVMHLESHEQVLQCLGEEVMGQLVEEQDVSFRKVDPVEKVFPSEAFLHIAKHRWHVAINKVRAWEMIEYAKGTPAPLLPRLGWLIVLLVIKSCSLTWTALC